MSGR
jgi:hypothetical protein